MSNNRTGNSRGTLLVGTRAHADQDVQACHNVTETAPLWSWITGHDETITACLAILQGKPGLYPIFGIQLHVEIRQGYEEDFPVLVYTDAKDGNEGQNLSGKLYGGLWIGISSLLKNSKFLKFKSFEDELFTLTMLAQPEMQEAKILFFEEENHRRQIEMQAELDLLNGLRNRVIPETLPMNASQQQGVAVKKVKIDYPVFSKMSNILDKTIGIFNHPSGVTIKVCNSLSGLVIRAHTHDEAHLVFAFSKNNLLLRQADVVKGTVTTNPQENFFREKEVFMNWLQEELKASSKPPQVTAATKTVTRVKATSLVSVDDVLGAAATNGVPEGSKKGFPAKKAAKPRTSKAHQEKEIALAA